jgi:hypothetical protein
MNMTEGKNKVIVSGLAGALSSFLIFLTVIDIAAKVSIIVTAAAVTYILLSLIHKVKARSAKTHGMSESEGYSSVDKGEEKDTEISVKEPKRTETELEEIIRIRAEEEMKNGLPKHMDLDGNSLAGADDTSQTKYATNYMALMQFPPVHMDGYYQEVNAPRTSVSNYPVIVPERLTMEYIVNQRD